MYKRIGFASTIVVAVVLMLAFSMTANLVWAQVTKTPSGGGITGFSIPTSTPAANTNSSGGGLLIPTSTPAGGAGQTTSGDVLPPLDAVGLQALNIQPEDIPAAFAANQTISPFDVEALATQIEANSKELAALLRQISAQYQWTNSIGIDYTACDPSLPVSRIYSEVAQLGSVDLARAFVDDPAVTEFYTQAGLQVSPATSVHGFYSAGPAQQGACFASETSTYLNFEYWGLLISVSLSANSTTDPAMIADMLDQLAGLVVARVDALAGGALQPTPSAGAQATGAQTANATATKIPFSLEGNNAQNNTAPAGTVTLADIDAVMPTIDEIGLPTDLFALNTDLSQPQTPEQIVAFWQSTGLTDIANALQAALQQSGSLGQVVRVWDTGTACPQTIGISIEVDVLLFQDANGPTTFLANQDYFNILAAHGVQFEALAGGGLSSTLSYTGACGSQITYSRIVPYGRFAISTSAIAYPASDVQTINDALDGLTQFTAQKLDQAGLQ